MLSNFSDIYLLQFFGIVLHIPWSRNQPPARLWRSSGITAHLQTVETRSTGENGCVVEWTPWHCTPLKTLSSPGQPSNLQEFGDLTLQSSAGGLGDSTNLILWHGTAIPVDPSWLLQLPFYYLLPFSNATTAAVVTLQVAPVIISRHFTWKSSNIIQSSKIKKIEIAIFKISSKIFKLTALNKPRCDLKK